MLDFRNRLKMLQELKGNPLDEIYTLFGEKLLPMDEIGFSKFEMQFENVLPNSYIVPLVLEVNVR